MTGSVLDILIYVFDRYMLTETPDVPERDALARDLERAGFAEANVERALDWLADLAGERERPDIAGGGNCRAVRVYAGGELAKLSTECRGLLLALEDAGILSAQQREIVIDRLLALDSDELDAEQVKWVVLMVLSSQPGQEQAYERMENLVFETSSGTVH
ncbi:MAG: DUF494 domain-containing protein [Steroidobacteraceae bacterium]